MSDSPRFELVLWQRDINGLPTKRKSFIGDSGDEIYDQFMKQRSLSISAKKKKHKKSKDTGATTDTDAQHVLKTMYGD